MPRWKCRIRPEKMEDARAALGPLADRTVTVEADDADSAVVVALKEFAEARPMTGLPADEVEEWLVAEPEAD